LQRLTLQVGGNIETFTSNWRVSGNVLFFAIGIPVNIECFIDHTILVNMSTTINRDWTNLPQGWVCMVVLGEFTEGGIVLPDLGVELPFQAGNVVFMRSWALWHFLKEYQGIER
jgi:hypothetical protein